MRRSHLVLVGLALVGCSQPAPTSSGDGTRRNPSPSAGDAEVAARLPPPDPREVALSAAVVQLLEQGHLRGRKIDDEISRVAFDLYLDQLDPTKMFLLAEDAEALRAHRDTIDDQLRSGDLTLAHEGARRFAARLEVVRKVVAELLATSFDLTDEEWVEIDPKKIELAKTDDELKDRWRKRLELEVLERVAMMEERLAGTADEDDDEPPPPPTDKIPTTPEAREAKARKDLAEAYAGRFARQATPDPLDAASDLVNAVAAAFDPHTNYLPPDDKANFDIQMTGQLEGIGAVLREHEHYIQVVEIVPGGASWRQGQLEAGDLVLSVAQQGEEPVDVTDMRVDEVVKMIRGKKGTVVTLEIQKPTGELELVKITRDVVVIEQAYARGAVLEVGDKKKKQKFGYIYLPSFYGGPGSASQRAAASDVERLLRELDKRKVQGVIIDIRSNGGGLLGDAVDLTGALIDRGPVVQTQKSDGTRSFLGDDERGTAYGGPVVLMVDRFSASASEIVAGALQDYERAIVVGPGPTHGKGTVQVLANLDELGVLKLTIEQYFRVSGASTQWQGIMPDVVLPDPAAHLETGERYLDNSIPATAVDPLPHEKWTHAWTKSDLIEKSAARIARHSVFSKIAEMSKLLRDRRDDTRVPLARPAWEKRRKELSAAIDAVSPDLDELPTRFAVTVIEDESKDTVAPRPDGKQDDRATTWRDNLARDPWIEESLYVLRDMAQVTRTAGR